MTIMTSTLLARTSTRHQEELLQTIPKHHQRRRLETSTPLDLLVRSSFLNTSSTSFILRHEFPRTGRLS
jgi:hypothetical protein